jgi:hypothetical protein
MKEEFKIFLKIVVFQFVSGLFFSLLDDAASFHPGPFDPGGT